MAIPVRTWYTVIVSDPENPDLPPAPMGRSKDKEQAEGWIAHLMKVRPSLRYAIGEIRRTTHADLFDVFGYESEEQRRLMEMRLGVSAEGEEDEDETGLP